MRVVSVVPSLHICKLKLTNKVSVIVVLPTDWVQLCLIKFLSISFYWLRVLKVCNNNNNRLIIMMEICSGISTKWLFIHFSLIELEFGFCGGRKTFGKSDLMAQGHRICNEVFAKLFSIACISYRTQILKFK